MRYLVDAGTLGLRAWHSSAFVPVPPGGCPLACPNLPDPERLVELADGASEIAVAADDDAQVSVWAGDTHLAGPETLTQRVDGRAYRVRGDGFWQVHPGAAATLTRAVLDGLAPRAGESAWDLYCGVGLFAGALSDAGCDVTGVEWSPDAVGYARGNVPGARFVAGRVERALARLPRRVDLVVLDPPRRGAGADIVARLAGCGPRAIAYVACDPAALARDLRLFAGHGYHVARIRCFDLFPMTHHVECVANLVPADPA
jgi:tRNA/tmRNA/rRNA uracil-C5-methylase (TrmA/RlmC/RlmD family)